MHHTFGYQRLEVFQVAKRAAAVTVARRQCWVGLPGEVASQLERAMVSVVANIVEGAGRMSPKPQPAPAAKRPPPATRATSPYARQSSPTPHAPPNTHPASQTETAWYSSTCFASLHLLTPAGGAAMQNPSTSRPLASSETHAA